LAVQISLDEHIVYVINGNRVERRVVKVGETVGNKVQILEGLTGTERVVVQGIQVLSDGAAINDIATNNGSVKSESANGEASL
jgi:multidrug efflux system membrane fusion protein